MATLLLIFTSVSQTFALPPGLLDAVCFVESSYRPKVIHFDDGTDNSMGLCQLQPGTAKMLGYKGNAKGLLNPKTNAYYAGKYLRMQLDRYDGDQVKAIAAYNSGSYLQNAKGLPVNRRYVTKVLAAWSRRQ